MGILDNMKVQARQLMYGTSTKAMASDLDNLRANQLSQVTCGKALAMERAKQQKPEQVTAKGKDHFLTFGCQPYTIGAMVRPGRRCYKNWNAETRL